MLGEITITRTRYPGGLDPATGRRVTTAGTDVSLRGSVQPLDGDELAQLPTGAESTSAVKIYITGDPPVVVGDELRWGDGPYEVSSVERHTAIIPHARITATARP